MVLRKYNAYAIPKHSLDEDEIRRVAIWADADDPDAVYQVAYDYGWEVLGHEGIEGTDEYENASELYNLLEFLNEEDW